MSIASIRALVLPLAAVLIVAFCLLRSPLSGAESAVVIAPPTLDNPKGPGNPQTAVLAGGCFWGVQGVFEHVRGVQRVVSGYAGGERATASYETVSSGGTGHAESVKITFDPAIIAQLDQSHSFPRPIVTRVDPLKGFYPAEDYHQDYLVHHPDQPYIAYNDLPKVENFRRTFPELYRDTPVLTTISRASATSWPR